MRSAMACAVLFALLAVLPAPARAGTSTDIALGLASFAVFNQVVGPLLRGGGPGWGGPRHVVHHSHRTIVSYPAVVYATPAPVVVMHAPVGSTIVTTPVMATQVASTVVQYPHGRYELHWSGYQYTWVWIPAAPPPPPLPPPAVAPPPPAPPAPPAPAP